MASSIRTVAMVVSSVLLFGLDSNLLTSVIACHLKGSDLSPTPRAEAVSAAYMYGAPCGLWMHPAIQLLAAKDEDP